MQIFLEYVFEIAQYNPVLPSMNETIITNESIVINQGIIFPLRIIHTVWNTTTDFDEIFKKDRSFKYNF